MKILAIETSCDETAVAILEIKKNIKVLSNIISSQVKLHAKYGGVVPNLAAREHVRNIEHVFKRALGAAKIENFKKEIDTIAVTCGPGLGPALLVGIAFAKTLAWKYNKPLVGVNHLEGHIYSHWLNNDFKASAVKFPILHLIVSGGHTELVLMKGYGKYELIGETLDDAAGEAFDKVARLLGLGYPGGPAVAARAAKLKVKNARPRQAEGEAGEKLKIKFPRPMEKSGDLNFSYSGLKTAVLYKIRDLKNSGIKINGNVISEICYEFQQAAVDVLIKKTEKAVKEYKVDSIMLSGGVSANTLLRNEFKKLAENNGLHYSRPALEYTGDNAAMIAVAGYYNKLKIKNKKSKISWDSVEMDANLSLVSSI